jgi:hypothetical protein
VHKIKLAMLFMILSFILNYTKIIPIFNKNNQKGSFYHNFTFLGKKRETRNENQEQRIKNKKSRTKKLEKLKEVKKLVVKFY